MSKEPTYTEVVKRFDSKLDKHGEALAVINQHLSQLNGSVSRITEEIWGDNGLKDKTLATKKDLEVVKNLVQENKEDASEYREKQKQFDIEQAVNRAQQGSLKAILGWILDNALQPILIAIVLGLIMKGI